MDPHLRDETLERLLGAEATGAERDRVVRHLDRCPECRVLVSELARAEPAASGHDAPDPRVPAQCVFAPGDSLGRLVLVRVLGQGGMGRVFEAYDPHLRRAIALKVLSGTRSSASQTRLLDEARLLARVEHPHVVTVFDVAQDGQHPYLTMELVRGRHLGSWVAAEDPSVAEIVSAVLDAGRGLAAAHRAGVVHRDVKPSNILRTPEGRVVVIDFGLGGVAEELSRRRSGVASGTPGYMAPEQAAGLGVDERADQYGLAASCARLLEPRAGQATRGSRRLAAVLDRALQDDPDRRFESMDEMLEALERATRSRVPVAAAVVLGLSGLAWAATGDPERTCPSPAEITDALWGQQRKAVERAFGETGRPFATDTFARTDRLVSKAVDEHADAVAQTCRATPSDRSEDALLHERRLCLQRRGVVIRQFTSALIDDAPTTLDRAVETALSLAHANPCTDPDLAAGQIHGPHIPLVLQTRVNDARTRLEQSALAHRLGRLDEAEQALSEAAALAATVELQALDAEVDLARYDLHDSRGRYDQALAAVERASHAADASGHDVVAAAAKTRMVYALATRFGRLQDAELLAPFAEAAAARLPPSSRRTILAELSLHRAVVARLQGHAALALDWLDDAEVYTAWTPSNPLDEAKLLDERANISRIQGDPAAASIHARAAAVVGEHLGRLHPAAIFARAGAASAQVDAGSYEAAVGAFDEVLADLDVALGPGHPQRAAIRFNQSIALSELGRLDEAEAALREVIALRLDRGVEQGHLIIRPLQDLASVLIDQDRLDEAEVTLDQAETKVGADGVSPSVALMGTLMRIRIALERGDAQGAGQMAFAALRRVDAQPDASAVDLFNVRILLGDAKLAQGDAAQARAEFRRAREVLGAVAPSDPFIELSRAREAAALLALGRVGEGLSLASSVLDRAEAAPHVLASARAVHDDALRLLDAERG